jgi:hypothetical protein
MQAHGSTGLAGDIVLRCPFHAAEALGLPLLQPSLSLAANQSVRRGVNFAVGGATALERAFFVDNGFKAVSPFNISLGVQLGWFDALKPALCGDSRQGSFVLATRFRTHASSLIRKCSDLKHSTTICT